MKQSIRCRWLLLLSLVSGAVGAALRIFYFKNALDGEGFLLRNQPSQVIFWILAVGVIIAAALLSLKAEKEVSIPAEGSVPGICRVLMGLALLITTFQMDRTMSFYLPLKLLGWLTSAALLADGILRCLHKKTNMLSAGLLCIFLLLYAVASYSVYRSVPEMEWFLTPALAHLLLLPLSCELAAWDHGMGSNRRLLFLSAAVCFFSAASLGCSGVAMLHVGALILSMQLLFSLRRE